jgi:hypothetical protein
MITPTRQGFHDPAKTGAVMVALGALLISFSGVYVKLAHSVIYMATVQKENAPDQ